MSPSDTPSIAVDTASDGSLLIQVGGAWSIHGALPSLEAVLARIQPGSGVKSLHFDFSALVSYDSSLISMLVDIAKQSQANGTSLDTAALPEGVRQLLMMALAVPERRTREHPTKELFFTRLGKAGLSIGADVMEVFAFIGHSALSLVRLLRGRAIFRHSDTWLIIQRCSAEALPIVTLINFLIGIIVGFVGAVQLKAFGATIYMADLVGIAMVRELGCIMTAIIMSGRTGAAFAAEIGSMKVNQEIDALKTLGFSPVDFLVLPRMLALVAMMPLLTAYGNVMGMLGGGLIAPAFGVSLLQYYNELVRAVDLPNYSAGILKSFVFGLVVAGSGCLKGIQSGKSSSAVGMATTSAVVTAITAIVVLDAVFAFAMTALGI